jgi:hypothetical protein
MAFTTLSTVRKHLVAANLPETRIENVKVTLNGTTNIVLPHANLEGYTEKVKRLASDLPTRETGVLLVEEKDTDLAHKEIARDSVAVASNLALDAIYTEEIDYRVNREAGSIQRLASGSIPNVFPVVVWYDYFTTFDVSSDYVMDYSAGTIRRASGSTIMDGETVYLDYTVMEGWAEDALINQAIIEAQDMIESCLREGYNGSSTDQGLKTGATYMTLGIVSRGMAALMLTRNTGSDANSRAREWQQLCEKWTEAAWNVLAPFVNPHSVRSVVVD